MDSLKLIARIAGQRIALTADAVESVVEIEAITPVPLAPPHVAGLAALRSRVLTVIDSYAALELGQSPRDGLMPGGRRRRSTTISTACWSTRSRMSPRSRASPIRSTPASRAAGRMPRSAWSSMTAQALLLLDPARIVAGPLAAARARVRPA